MKVASKPRAEATQVLAPASSRARVVRGARPADWLNRNETEASLRALGWAQLMGDDAAKVIQATRQTAKRLLARGVEAMTLRHLLAAPGGPIVMRSPQGESVLLEPQGNWPDGLARPEPNRALHMLRSFVDPRAPVRASVLELLAPTLPANVLDAFERIRPMLRESQGLEFAPQALKRLGPFAEVVKLFDVDRPALGASYADLRTICVRPGLRPRHSAAIFRHELVTLLWQVAKEFNHLDEQKWHTAYRDRHRHIRSWVAGVDHHEFAVEVMAALMEPHPIRVKGNDLRLWGQARLAGTPGEAAALDFLGPSLRRLLRTLPQLAPVEFGEFLLLEKEASTRAWVDAPEGDIHWAPIKIVLALRRTHRTGSLACWERSPGLLPEAKAALAVAKRELALMENHPRTREFLRDGIVTFMRDAARDIGALSTALAEARAFITRSSPPGRASEN